MPENTPDYQKLYFKQFGIIANCIEELEKTTAILRELQQEQEEQYCSATYGTIVKLSLQEKK